MIVSGTFRPARVGHVCKTTLGKMLQTTPKDTTDQEVPYLRAGLLNVLAKLSELPTMFAGTKEMQTYGVGEGDLLVAEGGDVGRTEIAPRLPDQTIFQNSLHRLRLRDDGDLRFVRYALMSIHSSGFLDVLCNRATFGHLTVEKIRQLQIPWPRASEQRAIADFLDVETARIDALITKKQRLIDLLDARFSVRCRAETSSPDFKSVALRRVVKRVQTGTTPGGSAAHLIAQDGEVEWVTPGDFASLLTLSPTERRLKAAAVHQGHAPCFPAGSVLVIGIGATAGRVAFADRPCSSNQQVSAIISNQILLPRFLAWQLWARTDEMRATAPYTTLPILNNDFLKGLDIVIPPIEMQHRLVRQIDSAAEALRSATASLRQQIVLLGERRRALVTAAVTGGLVVPGVVV